MCAELPNLGFITGEAGSGPSCSRHSAPPPNLSWQALLRWNEKHKQTVVLEEGSRPWRAIRTGGSDINRHK